MLFHQKLTIVCLLESIHVCIEVVFMPEHISNRIEVFLRVASLTIDERKEELIELAERWGIEIEILPDTPPVDSVTPRGREQRVININGYRQISLSDDE